MKDPVHFTDMLGLPFHLDLSLKTALPWAYANFAQVTLKANDRNTR